MNQVHLIDADTKKLRTQQIEPLWSDEQNVLVADTGISAGEYVATTMLVYAPEGAVVDIITDYEAESLAGQPASGEPTP